MTLLQNTRSQGMETEKKPMVVRVTKTEFELDDGRIYPMLFDLSDDEIPTVDEFQLIYDQCRALFKKMKWTGDGQTTGEHK